MKTLTAPTIEQKNKKSNEPINLLEIKWDDETTGYYSDDCKEAWSLYELIQSDTELMKAFRSA